MNVKELRDALSDMSDETKVHGLFDGGFGVVDDPEIFIEEWDEEPVAVVIDFSPSWRSGPYGRGYCHA